MCQASKSYCHNQIETSTKFGTKQLRGCKDVVSTSRPECAINSGGTMKTVVATNNREIILTNRLEENNLFQALHSKDSQSCAKYSSHDLDSVITDTGGSSPSDETSIQEREFVNVENSSNLNEDISENDFRDYNNGPSENLHTSNVLGTSSGKLDTEDTEDPNIILNELKAKNSERLIIAQININALEHKFEAFVSMIKNRVDIIMVSETKVDESFPLSQFKIDGYSSPFRIDRNTNGGGIMIYFPEYLPCRKVESYCLPGDVEGMFIEMTVRNTKWLIVSGYNPRKEFTSYFLGHVSKGLDKALSNYDNFLVIGDFNSQTTETHMKDFCELYSLENLIKEPTCYKNPNNPSLIDLMLTNRKKLFLQFHNN